MERRRPGSHFEVIFDQDGQVIDVVPPEGKKLQKRKIHELKQEPLLVDHMSVMVVLSKPHHSPCCIIIGDTIWCWC